MEKCRHLQALNLSYCGAVNNATLAHVARFLKDLELFHCAFCTEISDSGVYAFATKCFVPKLKSLDLSFCSSISDDGIAAVAEKCTNLEYLNVAGLHRVTDSAARHITHNLWRLQRLNLEDLHLITDAVFHFDSVRDGRIAAAQNMLGSLTELHVDECTRLTDRGLGGLSTRCPRLERLHCGGVSNITDAGIAHLVREPTLLHARGDRLRVLDLSRCCAVTDAAVDALARSCPALDDVDLGCCLLLTDRATRTLCDHCPSIKNLGLARCRRMTDASARVPAASPPPPLATAVHAVRSHRCLIADALWLEALDFSHNPRLTDAATEVLAVELAGLTHLDLTGCVGLTDGALAVLRYHATNLTRLAVVDCIGLSDAALDLMHVANHGLSLLRTVDDVAESDRPKWVAAAADDAPPPPAPHGQPPPAPAH